jgi:DNA-binding protein H-NS
MNLKSMSIDALIGLRGKIDTVLGSKVADERRSLETELAKLTRFETGGSRSKSGMGRGARGKVAPKYRNPENPAETWAGRPRRRRAPSASNRDAAYSARIPLASGTGKIPNPRRRVCR